VARVLSRVVQSPVLRGLALLLTVALLAPAQSAGAASFAVVDHGPTQGTPVPGALLTADLGTWSSPPSSYTFQWLRDGAPIAGATSQDYPVQEGDVGHQVAPQVTGTDGNTQASFTGDPLTIRKIGSKLTLEVRRVHPAPTKNRLVWMAISFMTTERPYGTDGGTVVAYKKKGDQLKRLGSTTVIRGAAFVRLPWKRAPHGKSKVMVCYQGSDVVAASCSRWIVVHRNRA